LERLWDAVAEGQLNVDTTLPWLSLVLISVCEDVMLNVLFVAGVGQLALIALTANGIRPNATLLFPLVDAGTVPTLATHTVPAGALLLQFH